METLDVIAVGAHPDDCEIGCGGTLAALAKSGLNVGIIDLTDGEPTPGSPSPDVRIAEAHAAAETLGLTKRVILDLPNRRLFDSFEARVALAKQFRIFKPRLVIGLGEKTPTASPDHWQAAQITDAAVFYSRLTKSGVIGRGSNQFVHDITDCHQQKIAAIECYKTQFPPDKAYVFEKVRAMDSIAGVAAGFQFGEVFTSTKSVGSRDLFATLQLDD